MATDYDAPRQAATDDVADESLEALAASRAKDSTTAVIDVDDADPFESFELPDADLTGEELTVKVLPKMADEFTCSSCFLVHHKHRLAKHNGSQLICSDCV